MKERIVKLGVVGALALTLPAAAAAHGPGDAAKGLDKAAQHSQGNSPTTVGESDESGKPESAGTRPQNHGWFVSQTAKDKTKTATNAAGSSNHGAAVAAVAKGDQGK